jgi:hypothetical protein
MDTNMKCQSNIQSESHLFILNRVDEVENCTWLFTCRLKIIEDFEFLKIE